MEASHSLGTFHRILHGLWAVLTKPVPMRPAPRVVVRRGVSSGSPTRTHRVEAPVAPVVPVEPVAVTRQPVMMPRQVVQEATHHPVIPEAVAPAPAKPMRTLEEVRADLARLRERSRKRQAQAPAPRDIGFAPTDFMDFAQPVLKSPKREAPESNFAPTAFLDFTTLKVRGAH